MTVAELLEAIRPALREILTADELAATSAHVSWAPEGTVGLGRRQALSDSDVLRPEALLEIRTLGEHAGIWVDGDESAPEVYARVRSDLQDFVAESTFGWGQLRK